jgi:hypothetical protein
MIIDGKTVNLPNISYIILWQKIALWVNKTAVRLTM